MNTIGRVIATLNAAGRWLCSAMLLAMTFVLFANVVARNFLGYSYIGTEAVGTYLMVWLTFIGAAFIVRSHGHVSVDLLLRVAGARMLRTVMLLTAVVGMVTSGYMAMIGFELTRFIFRNGQVETTLGISTGFLYLPLPVGMILMLLNYADLFFAVLRKDDSRLPSAATDDLPVVASEG